MTRNINDLFPSKYLKASDIPDGGMRLTIKELTVEDVGQGENKEEKPCLYFMETDKGIVLNKTNSSMIASLYGINYDQWGGCIVGLHIEQVTFQGKITPAIRVDGKKFPRATKAASTGPKVADGNTPSGAKYGIAMPYDMPALAMESIEMVSALVDKASVLKSDASETIEIRAMLGEIATEMKARNITWNYDFKPATVGQAVDYLRAMVDACASYDSVAVPSEPPF